MNQNIKDQTEESSIVRLFNSRVRRGNKKICRVQQTLYGPGLTFHGPVCTQETKAFICEFNLSSIFTWEKQKSFARSCRALEQQEKDTLLEARVHLRPPQIC